jgi:hypothetical protein
MAVNAMFEDGLTKTGNFAISDIDNDNSFTTIVDPNSFTLTPNNISDGGRLADNIDYEGSLKGVKYNVTLEYNNINLEHFKEIYDRTQKRYNDGGGFFLNIKVPLYVENRVETMRVYFGSSFDMKVKYTTEYIDDARYKFGGSEFSCMYGNITISFVQK